MGIYCKEIDGRAAFFDEAVHGARMIELPLSEREIAVGKRAKTVPNPDTLIPADAVEVSPAEYRRLFDAQSLGKALVVRGGCPVAVDQPVDADARRAARARQRDRLLAACDWTQLPDTLAGDPQMKAAWAEYRQALRDLDMDATDWPTAPGGQA